jgi:hypothetical protein
MLAYDVPILGVVWSLMMFAIDVLWLFTVIYVFIDNFLRRGHHGGAKALWARFIILVPFIGVLATSWPARATSRWLPSPDPAAAQNTDSSRDRASSSDTGRGLARTAGLAWLRRATASRSSSVTPTSESRSGRPSRPTR